MELPASKGLRLHPSHGLNNHLRNADHQNSPGFLNMQDPQDSHISTGTTIVVFWFYNINLIPHWLIFV